MRARWILSLLLLFALAIPALAQNRRGGPSLDRVLPHVRQSVPGTFYDAEGPFPGQDGRMSYRLKWMTPDGRIIWFSVDAQSGQVIGGVPRGAPGRSRDDGAGRGAWGAPRNNWQQDDNSRSGWGGQGGGQGGWGNDRGNGWGNGNDRGNGWGHGRDNGGDRDNGWRGNRGDGPGDDRGSGRSNDRGSSRGGDRGNGWGNGGGRGGSWGGGGEGRGGDSRGGSGGRRHPGGG